MQSGVDRKLKWKSLAKGAGIGCVAIILFLTGVGVGNGSLTFGSSVTSENESLPEDLDYASIERLYDRVKENYDGKLDANRLLDGMKTGLAEATGDPYTVYLNAKDAANFTQQLNGMFSGIGAELGQDEQRNLIIVAPIDGFPAQKAGLRPQDIIVSINDKSTAGMSIEEAVSKIRGPKGSEVKLGVLRGKTENVDFKITRADIELPSVESEILEGNIGYIQITQFNENAVALTKAAAAEFKQKNVKAVLLDLRGNPGGTLEGAVDIASLWVPKGKTILQQKRGSVVVSTETAKGGNILAGIPTAVLINEGSASASEIVAGALKDHKAATLFGTKSYGKGSVQELHPFTDDSELKVTVARWYRPNGQNIDKKGIEPDKKVDMTDEDYEQKRDPQKDAAIEYLKK